MDDQTKNLLLATGLSFLVIFVWFILFPPEPPVTTTVSTDTSAAEELFDGSTAVAPPAPAAPQAAGGQGTAPAAVAPSDVATATRIAIETPRLEGSLSLTGARLDDLKLTDYRETLDPGSPTVRLLNPSGGIGGYYALHGWVGPAEVGPLPNATTEWTIEAGDVLTPDDPVTLRWENGAGLIFLRTISVDENYLFTISQTVENQGTAPVRLTPYGLIVREGEPETIGFYILHEGVVGLADDVLVEIDYDDLTDAEFDRAERGRVERRSSETGGWIGFTDKNWMTTLIPPQGQSFTAVAKYVEEAQIYQADMRLPPVEIAAGGQAELTSQLFAGAKEWEAIRDYQDNQGVTRFVDSIDWGWFAFLTKPIFWGLHHLNGLIGNMGVSIITLTLIIKALLFPLAYKSFVAMSKMKQLQPEMEKIKERAGDDRQKLQQEMMALYKKERVNPASGCLPILLQIPIFFALYKVLYVTIEMRHAPFIGWIRDLSAPDPSSYMNLFGLLPFSPPPDGSILSFLSIGVFPILMGVTMWMQQKLNPAPTDPTQAMIFNLLPWVFMFMLGNFASGLVIYWVANNVITFTQQYIIMRSQGVQVDFFGNVKASFRRKSKKPAE
ncbi:MAG: membrane protein insertase YidC [Pseudomonadota bacterium]